MKARRREDEKGGISYLMGSDTSSLFCIISELYQRGTSKVGAT